VSSLINSIMYVKTH